MALLPCDPSGPRAAPCIVVLRVTICSPQPPRGPRSGTAGPWVPRAASLLRCTSAMSLAASGDEQRTRRGLVGWGLAPLSQLPGPHRGLVQMRK